MEEEIITPEAEVFDYKKLRYILDKDGYVCHASLGALIICDLGECTEYNGEVPIGYSTIEEWHDKEIDKLNAWKIVDGDLVYDETKYKELQALCKVQEEENSCASRKWVNDRLKVSSSVVTDELSSEATGTSLIVLNDAGNYEIPELKIESATLNKVNVISSNKNILGIDGITTTINGVEIKNNGDGTLNLNGTATDNIEYNLNGSNTNQEMFYLIKDNTNYAISGLADNVSLSLYSFDGTDRVYVGNYINQNFTLSNQHKITQTILSIPSGATFEKAIIKPQIEIGEATEFIKHEETNSIGFLEDNECIVTGLMSYTDKTIIMIDEEVLSSIKYYRYKYLNEKFAEIEINEKEVKSTVAEMNETIEGQNTAISQISQTVNEIKSEINDAADITISADGYGSVYLEKINESEPVYIKIYPSENEDISYLYPSDNLYPSDDLFPRGRTIRFDNGDYYIDYELPNDLLYYDENNYDEFILDYDNQKCEVNKRVGYNADGSKYLLETPQIISYKYPSLPLEGGDYTVSMLGYDNAYMFVRMMCDNIYTNQFATKVELNSAIIQTKDSITSQVKAEYATKNDLVTTETKINQTTNAINLEVSKKVNNTDYTSANIIAKVNNDTSSIQIKASKIDLNGYLTISNASSTYATNSSLNTTNQNLQTTNNNLEATNNNLANNYSSNEALKTSGSTIINGDNITTGTISASRLDAKVITTDNFSAQKISANNIVGGTITSSAITLGSVYSLNSNGHFRYYNGVGFISCGRASGTNHPWLSAVNVNYQNGISFRTGTTWSDAGDNVVQLHATNGYLESTTGFRVNGNINATGHITGSSGTGGVYLTLTDNDFKINGYAGKSGAFKYQATWNTARVLEFKYGILINEYSA